MNTLGVTLDMAATLFQNPIEKRLGISLFGEPCLSISELRERLKTASSTVS